jgi:LacI family transcriptional regulator
MGKPTINDVARVAGVSKKTVSRVINHSPLLSVTTRERVEGVIEQLGFVPDPQARALALRRNFLVALVHDASMRPLVGEVAMALDEALRGSGYALILHALDSEPETALRSLLQAHRPSSIVLLAPTADSADLASLCASFEVGCLPLQPESDRAAMARLVHWLVANGHRRIGLVAGPDESSVLRERELGYLDALADHGLDRGAALVVQGDGSFESGVAAGHLLLAVSPRPTVVAAVTDEMAAGVIHAAHDLGIDIPEVLAVTGFDDAPLAARLSPPLTTVRTPWTTLAAAAAARILGRPDSSAPEAELIVRGSVNRLA